jgi:hypothetical protein
MKTRTSTITTTHSSRQQHAFLPDTVLCNQPQVVAAVPKGGMCIASLDAMQPDGAEIDQGRELKR